MQSERTIVTRTAISGEAASIALGTATESDADSHGGEDYHGTRGASPAVASVIAGNPALRVRQGHVGALARCWSLLP